MFVKLSTTAALVSSLLLGGCQHSGLWGDDEFVRYSQRVDKITESAGDAKEWNRVVQTNNPYPRSAYDHRIPVSAIVTGRAIQCHEGTRPTSGTQTNTRAAGISVGGVGVGTATSISAPQNDC